MEASDDDKPATPVEEEKVAAPETKPKRTKSTRSKKQVEAFERARARRKANCDAKRKQQLAEQHAAYVESLEKRAAKRNKKKAVVVSSSSESSSESEPEPPRRRKGHRARRRSPSPVSASDDEPAPPEHGMASSFIVV